MIFKRKKAEKPKNQLGLALYHYDAIFNGKLKNLIKILQLNKSISVTRANNILNDVFSGFDSIMEDISKENFKTDYRSDKTRDFIISMIESLKKYLENASSNSFNISILGEDENRKQINNLLDLRQSLKKKMKDIESDYI